MDHLYHALRCGWGHIHPCTFKPLTELDHDAHVATKVALKLHAHSAQSAYKFASTRHTFDMAGII
eukprot:979417-Pelagomonas_calceolata.AAC.6